MRRIIPTGCEAFIQFILGCLEPTLECRHSGQVGAVLQILELFAPLHLLQKKLRIMHRDFQRQLAAIQSQQVTGALGRALEGLVSLVEACRLLQGQALLALGSIGKTVWMNPTRQLAVARGQLLEIQAEARLQLK